LIDSISSAYIPQSGPAAATTLRCIARRIVHRYGDFGVFAGNACGWNDSFGVVRSPSRLCGTAHERGIWDPPCLAV